MSADAWKPFTARPAPKKPRIANRIQLRKQSRLMLSDDVVRQLGAPKRVQLLTNGSRDAFAVRPAVGDAGAFALTPLRLGRQRVISCRSLFRALQRDAARLTQAMVLPHHWDGDLLIVDVSQVPDAAEATP